MYLALAKFLSLGLTFLACWCVWVSPNWVIGERLYRFRKNKQKT